MDYKYKDTRVTMWDWKSIDEYISYKYNRLLRYAPHDIHVIKDEEGKPYAINYLDGFYYFGELYFVGYQHVDGIEGHCIPVNHVHRLVGVENDNKDPDATYKPNNMLVFQDIPSGKTFRIPSGSTVIKLEELMRQQQRCGFEYPEYMEIKLPTHPDKIEKYNTRKGNDIGNRFRDWLDAAIVVFISFLAFNLTSDFLLLLALFFGGLVVIGLVRAPEATRNENEKNAAVKKWNEVYNRLVAEDKKRQVMALKYCDVEKQEVEAKIKNDKKRKWKEKEEYDQKCKEKQEKEYDLFMDKLFTQDDNAVYNRHLCELMKTTI